MERVTKAEAIKRLKNGETIYSVRHDGQLATLFKSKNRLLSLKDRDGRRFGFFIGVK